MDDVADGFVAAADGDGQVDVVASEEREVDVEVFAQLGFAEEMAVQEILVFMAGDVAD